MAQRLARTFGRTPHEIARARRLVVACLDTWDVAAEDRWTLELVVSELMANAACHGLGSVELRVYASDAVVRIEVWDQGGGLPRQRPAERTGARLGGFGLHLVDQLTDAWGTWVRPGRTVVWAQRAIAAGSVRTLRSRSDLRPLG